MVVVADTAANVTTTYPTGLATAFNDDISAECLSPALSFKLFIDAHINFAAILLTLSF